MAAPGMEKASAKQRLGGSGKNELQEKTECGTETPHLSSKFPFPSCFITTVQLPKGKKTSVQQTRRAETKREGKHCEEAEEQAVSSSGAGGRACLSFQRSRRAAGLGSGSQGLTPKRASRGSWGGNFPSLCSNSLPATLAFETEAEVSWSSGFSEAFMLRLEPVERESRNIPGLTSLSHRDRMGFALGPRSLAQSLPSCP